MLATWHGDRGSAIGDQESQKPKLTHSLGIPYLPWDSIAASDKPRDGQGRQCADRLSRAGRPMIAKMDG
jgi:hypothetical protein